MPRFLEARGLDVSAELLPRLQEIDAEASLVIERIYHDELRHVAIGTFWHRQWCEHNNIDSLTHFAEVCQRYFQESKSLAHRR